MNDWTLDIKKYRFLLLLVAILFVVVLIRLCVLQPFVVSGASMEPNFTDGDVVMVAKVPSLFGVHRGDVLVFHNPHDPDQELDIKRVIGLPGERVRISDEGVIITHLDNSEERFASGSTLGGTGNGSPFEIVLGREDYFVLGDNRSNSTDSRVFGAVQRGDMVGTVLWGGDTIKK